MLFFFSDADKSRSFLFVPVDGTVTVLLSPVFVAGAVVLCLTSFSEVFVTGGAAADGELSSLTCSLLLEVILSSVGFHSVCK